MSHSKDEGPLKVAILGGAGGMGGAFGAKLAEAGHTVTLLDVSAPGVEAIRRNGVTIEAKDGSFRTVRVAATTQPGEVGQVDLVVNFVKCYHTEPAVTSILPLLRDDSFVLSLQNGWGNAPKIAGIVGENRVLLGVTYHSATLLAPGHVLHAGLGPTYMGPLAGSARRADPIARAFNQAGLEVTVSEDVRREIWAKLLLNICTLPTSALLRFGSVQLVQQEGTLSLMRNLLREGVAVAKAQGIAVDEDERWTTITGLLARVGMSKSSMLQDVEAGRKTEIDVINGAIVAAGERLGVPTPHNQTMLWLCKAHEGAVAAAKGA